MFTSAAETIKALFDLGKSFFDKLAFDKQHQAETVVIKDKEKLKHSADVAEECFWLMREYMAADSQFVKWICNIAYDLLSKEQKRYFKKFCQEKIKLKKQIEKKQKEFEKVD